MTTPHISNDALLRRLVSLEKQLDEAHTDIADLQLRLGIVEEAATRRSSSNERHEAEKKAILAVLAQLPPGFKVTVPAITENLDDVEMTAASVTTRVGTLVREGKIRRHQVGNQHPTFSLPS